MNPLQKKRKSLTVGISGNLQLKVAKSESFCCNLLFDLIVRKLGLLLGKIWFSKKENCFRYLFAYVADKRHLFCPVVMVALTDQMARQTVK